jgi:hypothetical protein
MNRNTVVSLVGSAFLLGFVLGAVLLGRHHAPAYQDASQLRPAVEPVAAPAEPSPAELRAAFVRQEAQRMEDESQGKARVELRGPQNEYVLVVCPGDSAELAEWRKSDPAAYRDVAIKAPKTIGKFAVEEQMKKDELKRLGFVAVMSTADRASYWKYDVATNAWTLEQDKQVPW